MMCGRPIFTGDSSWGQMYAIVRVLGTPTEREMEALTKGQGSRLAKHFASLAKLKRPRQALADLLPHFAHVAGSLAVPRRLLAYAPSDRWHPTRLLKSRFLSEPLSVSSPLKRASDAEITMAKRRCLVSIQDLPFSQSCGCT